MDKLDKLKQEMLILAKKHINYYKKEFKEGSFDPQAATVLTKYFNLFNKEQQNRSDIPENAEIIFTKDLDPTLKRQLLIDILNNYGLSTKEAQDLLK